MQGRQCAGQLAKPSTSPTSMSSKRLITEETYRLIGVGSLLPPIYRESMGQKEIKRYLQDTIFLLTGRHTP
ncbi:hypothetical protein TNCV_2021511 [Trichonephila clavipes]|nr:hypothetical protein TNCV_2021511 [Trichonephila clavipes]